MNILTIGRSSLHDAKQRPAAAFRDEPHRQRLSFISIDLLWKIISPKRRDINRSMTGQVRSRSAKSPAGWIGCEGGA